MSALFIQYLAGDSAPEQVRQKPHLLLEAGFHRWCPDPAASDQGDLWALFGTQFPRREGPLAGMRHADILTWLRRTVQPGVIHEAKTWGLSYG